MDDLLKTWFILMGMCLFGILIGWSALVFTTACAAFVVAVIRLVRNDGT